MADVFLSYHHSDRRAAESLASQLSRAEITCWWDASLVAGDTFSDAIRAELRLARVVVVLWSEASWSSRWVQAEAQSGLDKDALVAARLDDVELEPPFNTIQTADLRKSSGIDSLISGIERKLGKVGADQKPKPRLRSQRAVRSWTTLGIGALVVLLAVVSALTFQRDRPAEIVELDGPSQTTRRSFSFEVRFAQSSFWLNASADEIAHRFADLSDDPPDSVVIHSTCRLQRDHKLEEDRATAVFVAIRRGGIPAEAITIRPCDLMIAPAIPPGTVRVVSHWPHASPTHAAVADAVCSAIAVRRRSRGDSYEGAVAVNPQTGDRLQWRNGEWHAYPRVDSAEWRVWADCCSAQDQPADGYREYISRYPQGALVSEACNRLGAVPSAP